MSLCQLISNDRLPPPELASIGGRPRLRKGTQSRCSRFALRIENQIENRGSELVHRFWQTIVHLVLRVYSLGLFLRTRNLHDPPFVPADCAKAQKWRNPWAGVHAKAAAAAMNYLVGPCERLFGSVLCCRVKIWIAL